jgi:hypothetical protein
MSNYSRRYGMEVVATAATLALMPHSQFDALVAASAPARDSRRQIPWPLLAGLCSPGGLDELERRLAGAGTSDSPMTH